jgi:glycosyltransferase involved in cell wall biosynthesis
MHVLYVNHTSRISGGELSLITLLRALPADVRATVACPEGPLAERLRGEGIDVVPVRGTDGSLRLHPTRTARALAEMAQAALQVRKAARAVDADLVHANSIRAGIVATACDRPTVVHVRDCLPAGAISSLSLRAVGRADALIANSAYTRSTLGRSGKDAYVIHNAVDLTPFEPPRPGRREARTQLGLGADDGPVLAVVAQITPWKGQDDAIEIARLLLPAHPALKLLLVGSPKFDSASTRYDNASFLAALRRQAAAPELGGAVHFLGERDDVPEVLGAVDLLVAPSWEEPFGRTLIEAMAAGVPVVATDVGGPPEIVAKAGSGMVLPPRRPELWAEAIDRLLADPARLEEMAARGRDAARARFGAERHAQDVLSVYESVLGGR